MIRVSDQLEVDKVRGSRRTPSAASASKTYSESVSGV